MLDLRIRCILLRSLLVLTLLLTVLPAIASEDVAWGTELSAAFKQAQDENKPVLVDVWAIWCVPCAEMDKTTYRDSRVLEAVKGFVPVKVDADVQKIFIERYRIDAYPTVLVLDAKGNEITRRMGLVTTAQMLDLLERTAVGYNDYLAARKDRKNPEAMVRLARYFAGSGNPEEACACYRTALKKLKKASAPEREGVQLEMAQAQIDAEHISAALKTLRPLADAASAPEIRGRALQALARAERARGHDDAATKIEQRLAKDFPALASESKPPRH